MFSNNLIAGAAGQASDFYPVSIDQSLRFNDDDSAYLSTSFPTSGTSVIKGTISVWVKRGNLGGTQQIYAARTGDGAQYTLFYFNADQLKLLDNQGASLVTTALFRDPSAWYHVVLSYDTSQATAADRVTIYVNGVEQVLTGTYPSQNVSLSIGYASIDQRIGRQAGSAIQSFDGYMAEFHFTDGTAYDADAFGEFKSGVWVAKTPSVTYGTNGFYLDFANSADIGNDVSGEGNDWTPNNFTASDVVLDSPTDNFCTLNPLDKDGSMTFADGNLQATSSGLALAMGTMTLPKSGKYVFEMKVTSGAGGNFGIARTDVAVASRTAESIYTCMVRENNTSAWVESVEKTSAWSSTFSPQWVQVRVNADDGEISWANESESTIAYSFSSDSYDWIPFMQTNSDTVLCNFGQSSFVITPPTDYLALSTANLPEPTISPADDASPEDYFNTVLWSGDGNDGRNITGVGFQPDWVWIKDRNTARSHVIQDSVRGFNDGNKVLRSNGTDSESSTDNDGFGFVGNTNLDGYTLEDGTTDGRYVNNSGETYVAWNWKANGSGVSNTDGDITTSVSANTTSGFSIIEWTNEGTNTDTYGHGLDQAPELYIQKKASTTGDWFVFYSFVDGSHDYLLLNGTQAKVDHSIALPTSTVLTTGAGNTDRYITYAFHSVEGFSKFGSYTGNGSTDGPFVYTGFRPAFLLMKRTDSVSSWYINDTSRSVDNDTEGEDLYANLSNAEGGTVPIDILSNGFKIRTLSNSRNQSGGTYIFMAFAENPFKYSNAR